MARAMMTKILMSIVATTMLVQLALAVDHNVGAPSGRWDQSTDLKAWASSETFKVGDNVVFSFSSLHDVVEVSKDNYDSCSISGAISTTTKTPATFELADAGSRYFICGTPGHCDSGMKVEIKTVSTSSTTPTPTTPASPSPPSSSGTPSPPASSTTPGTPAPVTPSPKPSSAETVKMTAVSIVGLGFLMMI